jgi:hypothetical protein
MVKHHMSWYVTRVQKEYPSLVHVNYTLLKSMPNATRQKLHYDYGDDVMNKDPERQPVSLIVAIDPFQLVLVDTSERAATTTLVSPGNCIVFTNKVKHCGEANNHQVQGKPATAVRMFAYMVSDEKDFPQDTVHYETEDEESVEIGDEASDKATPTVAAEKGKGKRKLPIKSGDAAVGKTASGGGRSRKQKLPIKSGDATGVMTQARARKPSLKAKEATAATSRAPNQCIWSTAGGKPCNPLLVHPHFQCSTRGCTAHVHQLCVIDWEKQNNYKGKGLIVCPEHHEYYQSVGGGGKA